MSVVILSLPSSSSSHTAKIQWSVFSPCYTLFHCMARLSFLKTLSRGAMGGCRATRLLHGPNNSSFVMVSIELLCFGCRGAVHSDWSLLSVKASSVIRMAMGFTSIPSPSPTDERWTWPGDVSRYFECRCGYHHQIHFT